MKRNYYNKHSSIYTLKYQGVNRIKKVILGSAMILAGSISSAMLLSGTMSNDWTVNGQLSALWNMSRYGLMPALYIFILIAVIGMIIAIWGVFEKNG